MAITLVKVIRGRTDGQTDGYQNESTTVLLNFPVFRCISS